MAELDAEIFDVGVWNGIPITSEMIDQMVNNFSELKPILDVPLKFGHNDKQPAWEDGEPALGWVDKVWKNEEGKLMGHFTDMPQVVYDAIKNKRYKNVSIEALFDVKHMGKKYGTVLTAVALLGVDMPAVNTLASLQTYMTSKNIEFSSHATFSKLTNKFEEEPAMAMTPEEQARMDRLEADLKAANDTVTKQAGEIATFKSENATLKAENKAIKDNEEKNKFAAEKESVTKDLDSLVKQKRITPAKRDSLLKEFSADTSEKVKFTIEVLKESSDNKGFSTKEEGMEHDHDQEQEDSGLTPDDKVAVEVSKLQMSNKDLSYSEAVHQVFRANPKLAKEYADYNDREE